MELYKFPATRPGLTRKINACGFDVYLTVNPTPDGQPGEVFAKIGKQGSTIAGMVQAFVVAVSVALRHGTPWSELYDKLKDMRFAPMTDEHRSIIDAIVRTVEDMRQEVRQEIYRRSGQKELQFGGGDKD